MFDKTNEEIALQFAHCTRDLLFQTLKQLNSNELPTRGFKDQTQ